MAKPVARKDSADRKAQEMIARLNGGGGVENGLGGVGRTAADLIAGITRGGKVSGSSPGAKATNEFVSALGRTSKPKSKVGDVDGRPLAQKLRGKEGAQGKRNDGGGIAADLLDALENKQTAIRPKAKKDGKHRGERLGDDQRSLLDGHAEDGSFIGPLDEQV